MRETDFANVAKALANSIQAKNELLDSLDRFEEPFPTLFPVPLREMGLRQLMQTASTITQLYQMITELK